MLSEEEFNRRVEMVVKTAISLLGESPISGAMSKGEALNFYEKIIKQLDDKLEEMCQEFVAPSAMTTSKDVERDDVSPAGRRDG